jgi:hypothetical protein
MTYTVQMRRTVLEIVTIEIEANSKDEAIDKAKARYDDGPDLTWDQIEVCDLEVDAT